MKSGPRSERGGLRVGEPDRADAERPGAVVSAERWYAKADLAPNTGFFRPVKSSTPAPLAAATIASD